MKIFNFINGLFYILFGLFGVFLPHKMATLMGWELSLLGFHQVRATSLVMASLGLMNLLYANKITDQKPLTLAIIFITLSFMAGRFLGLILDGAGPVQTYHEIGIEIIWAGLGFFLLKRVPRQIAN